jgi:hypothetical protein
MLTPEEQHYYDRAADQKVPPHSITGLVLYIVHRRKPGDFLCAVISNDLKEAIARADHINALALDKIVKFLYNEAPSLCWGSKEKMEAWLGEPE